MNNLAYANTPPNIMQYGRGSIVVLEGDVNKKNMYVILQGRAGLYKNFRKANQVHISTIQTGDFFNEPALFLNKANTETVIAMEDLIVQEVTRMNAYEFFEKQPAATFALIKSLCQRLDGGAAVQSSQPVPQAPQGQPVSPAAAAVVKNIPEPALSALFPDGHKRYSLQITEPDASLLAIQNLSCPLCVKQFSRYAVRQSALKLEKMEKDLRPRHKGVDTIHYDVATCPFCLYSAFSAQFDKALSSREKQLFDAFKPYKKDFHFIDDPKDAQHLFGGHYLALQTAPLCFTGVPLITGRLWMRVGWLYADCGDPAMEAAAFENARKDYLTAYEKVDIPASLTQQINLIIGELHMKVKDYESAKKFFFKAKTSREGMPIFMRHADERLAEMKELVH